MKQIEEVRGAVASVEHALNTAQPGDLLLIQADAIDETMDCVRRYIEALAARQQAAEVEEIAASIAAPGVPAAAAPSKEPVPVTKVAGAHVPAHVPAKAR